MNDTVTNPRTAAIVSLLLVLPFILIFTIPWLNIAPFDHQTKALFMDSGGNGLNTLGFVVMFGGLLLVPVAFVVNLTSMITKTSVDERIAFRFPRPANLILGSVMLLFILMLAGWMVVEAFSCSMKGVCD